MTFTETLAGLLAEIPKAICEPAALASLLRTSDQLAMRRLHNPGSKTSRTLHKQRGARGGDAKLPAIFYKPSLHDIVTDGPRLCYARPFGCARRLRRTIYAGGNSRLLRKHSPTAGT